MWLAVDDVEVLHDLERSSAWHSGGHFEGYEAIARVALVSLGNNVGA